MFPVIIDRLIVHGCLVHSLKQLVHVPKRPVAAGEVTRQSMKKVLQCPGKLPHVIIALRLGLLAELPFPFQYVADLFHKIPLDMLNRIIESFFKLLYGRGKIGGGPAVFPCFSE